MENEIVPAQRSDGELVDATLSGDHDAFGELVARYQDAVFGVAFHLVGDFEEARDIAQEAFINAYVQLPTLRSPDRFGRWLFRIASARAIDTLRRREHELVVADVQPRTDQRLTQEAPVQLDLACQLRQALAVLSKPTRLAVILHYVDGYSHNEVAQFIGISAGAVKVRLSRARARMRKEITEMVAEGLQGGSPGPEFAKMTVERLRTKAWGLFKGSDRESKDYRRAYAAYTQLRSKASDPQTAAEAQMMAGICLLNSGRFQEAIDAFWDAIRSYPEHVDSPLLAYLADAYEQAGEHEKSLCWRGTILAHEEGDPYRWPAESAHFWMARCLEELKLRSLAQKGYEGYLSRYPDGRWAAESHAGLQRTAE
ncbi:MAG TPA: sigma-70 family RNA polymerase sigma factor [Armatimonadota bacterium]|nr:sigma-70 family RNA polymerase sigma factor [Armatimonadota bacterium]